MSKWQARFFNLAKEAAKWSKDPGCQVGAALVAPDHRSFSLGYNGFPTGIEDTDELLYDKDSKNKLMVHAELNAILNARRDLTGWSLYSTKSLCLDCAKAAVQAGITTVVMPKPDSSSSWYRANIEALTVLNAALIQTFLIRDEEINQA
jgi:dCMP deaminase